MKRKLLPMILVAGIALTPVVATAAETDYSYLEDMSIKELKALDAAIHELLGDAPTVETEAIVEETEAEPVHMSEEEFFEDILNSYIARDSAPQVSNAEWNMMTYDEEVVYYRSFAETERDFAYKYENAVFDDLNIQYLCNQYVTGIFKQLEACEIYEQSEKGMGDYTFFNQAWNSGYRNRSYVIVELKDYFDVAFPEGGVANMREEINALDSLNEAETRNSQVDHETVKEVQTLLHAIGFKCWNIDGVAGKRTVKAIKRFQEMYGYEIDGMITDELIEELKQVKADKGIVDETEAETEK